MKPQAVQKNQPPLNAPEGLDPAQSVWVSASAGSGKTTLLVKRVLRLLLEKSGAVRRKAPRILCLTYTRAAAAEMQNRIQTVLAQWATMSDDALRDDLKGQFNLDASREVLKHARRLFGQVLDAPERVRVATLHAFCQMVLNRFPLEAGVPPHFALLEGDRLLALQNEVLQVFFASFESQPELRGAFDFLSARIGPDRLQKLFDQAFYSPEAWEKFFSAYPDSQSYEAALSARLDIPPGIDEKIFLESALRMDDANVRALCAALSTGSKTEQDCAEKITYWLESDRKSLTYYAPIYLTQKFEPRKKFPTKDFRKDHVAETAFFDAEMARMHGVMQQLFAIRFMQAQKAWYALFHALWLRLQQMKIAQGVLGYEDLILRTRSLLQNPSVCAWVLYKLDGGIDHLLVDEAQDTSPAQWDILFALLDEFLSGLGAREDDARSVFVVGDEKQSIYSFQGADRSRYLQAKDQLFARLTAAERAPQLVELKRSRRTPKAVLEFVDAVFADDLAKTGVGQHIAHESARLAEPSYVELWPPIAEIEAEPPTPWTPPLQREEAKPAPVQLAENIAAQIKLWLDNKWYLKSHDRAVRADDVLILLQRRSKLLLPIVRALKDAHIPVSGVDRMVLAQQAAVQDVLSLCRFLLLPEDDLTLAEVLRSPFIRLSDEQLFLLAHDRGERSLWQRVQVKAEGDAAFENARAYLAHLLSITDYVPVFTLLNEILFKPCPADDISGQHALIKRLGPDAADPLHELLAAALMQERTAPSLQLFVQAILRSERESKRDLSQAGGEVRILTVHSAKGLEAPIVIVPDLVRDPKKQGNQPSLYWSADGIPLASGSDAGNVPLLDEAKENAKQAQIEENRRLLYVALTRARDVLILCGLAPSENPENAPWHQFTADAMQRLGAEHLENGVLRHGDMAAFGPVKNPQKPEQTVAFSLPAWVRQPVDDMGEKRRVINPSQVAATNEKMLPPSAQAAAYRRGQLLHRLLQMLPMAKREEHAALAFDFLKHHQPGKSEATIRAEVEEVLRVMNDAVFAPLFGEGSRAEVPVIGRVEGKRISGQIDRLAITETDVLIIDFKTNRPPPDKVEDVSETYLAQMAAYRALLEKIYPGKRIRCALLWTYSLRLMELPEAFYARGRAILSGA